MFTPDRFIAIIHTAPCNSCQAIISTPQFGNCMNNFHKLLLDHVEKHFPTDFYSLHVSVLKEAFTSAGVGRADGFSGDRGFLYLVQRDSMHPTPPRPPYVLISVCCHLKLFSNMSSFGGESGELFEKSIINSAPFK